MGSLGRLAKLAVLAGAAIAAAVALVAALGNGNDSGARPARGHRGGRLAPCSRTVPSLGAIRSAVSSAAPGAVVCLADGEYGELSLSADKRSPGVTVRAAEPGRASIEGAEISGSWLTLARFRVRGEVTLEPGSRHLSVNHNRITGGYFGIDAGPTTSTQIADTTIRGNLFAGPYGEDALRLNRYHDSSDRDPYGILIEGNEFTGIRENGNHSDCLQSVWGGDGLYFVRNYLHDNRCQGFFVKDQPAPVSRIVLRDNLFLRNAAPCDPPSLDCGPPAIVQIFGPTAGIRLTRNTVWTKSDRSPVAFREGPFGKIVMEENVIFRAWSDWTGGFPDFVDSENLYCQWEGTLPRPAPSSRRKCSPGFRDPAHDDYRLRAASAPGVTWAPAAQHYGP